MHLTPVSDAEYGEFAERQVAEYALQLRRNAIGVTEERNPRSVQAVSAAARALEPAEPEILATARQTLSGLLADELRSQGHEFFVAHSSLVKPRIGWVWLSPAPSFLGANRRRYRWLSQLTLEETVRGHGWGRALLSATERHLAAAGVEQLWLRVFDWNTSARALYDAQGYELVERFTVDAHMRKRLL